MRALYVLPLIFTLSCIGLSAGCGDPDSSSTLEPDPIVVEAVPSDWDGLQDWEHSVLEVE